MATTEERAAQLEAEAAAADQEAYDSFERSDTDGFLSQWAMGLTAQKKRLEASIVRDGGRAEFAALFDLEGNLVPARLVRTQYGSKFIVFATAEDATTYGAPVVEWVNPFVKPATLERKGYRLGWVLAKAKADYAGNGGRGLSGATSVHVVSVRTDGGFDPDAEVLDDGTGERAQEREARRNR